MVVALYLLLLSVCLSVSFNEIRAVPWSDLPFFVFLVIFYLAIFATATSFFLIQYSAVRLSSIKVMAYTYAIPIWVVITEVVFLDISSDHVVLIGAAIISTCLSLLLLNRES